MPWLCCSSTLLAQVEPVHQHPQPLFHRAAPCSGWSQFVLQCLFSGWFGVFILCCICTTPEFKVSRGGRESSCTEKSSLLKHSWPGSSFRGFACLWYDEGLSFCLNLFGAPLSTWLFLDQFLKWINHHSSDHCRVPWYLYGNILLLAWSGITSFKWAWCFSREQKITKEKLATDEVNENSPVDRYKHVWVLVCFGLVAFCLYFFSLFYYGCVFFCQWEPLGTGQEPCCALKLKWEKRLRREKKKK